MHVLTHMCAPAHAHIESLIGNLLPTLPLLPNPLNIKGLRHGKQNRPASHGKQDVSQDGQIIALSP